jgi:hypothetical protein
MNVEQALMNLAEKRLIFHSEADFQHALAWELQQMYPEAAIRLEYKPAKVKARIYLDIWTTLGVEKIAIELKYKTKSLEVLHQGESFALLNHSAHDCGRYDFLKDIMRLEHVVQKEMDTIGYVIFITNDQAYWSSVETNTIDSAFRIAEGQIVHGELGWGEGASSGTIRGREKPLRLRGRYRMQWEAFSQVEGANGQFRCLCFKVEPPKEIDINGILEQLARDRPVFQSQMDLRDALLDQLQRRGLTCMTAKTVGEKVTVDIHAQAENGQAYAFEVRYKTSELHTVTKDGAVYQLKNQGAQDTGRYDFISDIVKLEQAAASGIQGYSIFITNDHLYWEEPKQGGTVDHRFRLHEGARLRGTLEWSKLASDGTVATREAPLELKGVYRPSWRHYAMPRSGQGGTFKVLVVKVRI